MYLFIKETQKRDQAVVARIIQDVRMGKQRRTNKQEYRTVQMPPILRGEAVFLLRPTVHTQSQDKHLRASADNFVLLLLPSIVHTGCSKWLEEKPFATAHPSPAPLFIG